MTFSGYQQYKDTAAIWPSQLPASWEYTPIKRLASMIYGDALPSELRDETGLVPVYGSNGAFGRHGEANTSSPAILVGRKGSCGALNWSDVPAFAIDTVYFVDDRYASCDLRWLYWAFHTANLGNLSQDTGVPGLSREATYEIRLPHPSASEQTAIANFLDRQTAKIDALVEEQKRLIALLKEKRQAVISHAVTKGLKRDAPMKDTGVEWLNEVPAHWVMRRLKHISPQITVGIVVNPSNYVSDEGLPFLYGGDITEGHIHTDGVRRINAEDSEANKKTKLRAGDIVTVRVGAPGISAVVPPSCEGGNCASVMLTRAGEFNSDWLCYAMNSRMVRYQVEVVQYGAAQEQFNISHAVNFWVAIPPFTEQSSIAQFLNDMTSTVDGLIAEAQRAIDLLQERRSALISAAVTGKIDVRGLVPDQAEAA